MSLEFDNVLSDILGKRTILNYVYKKQNFEEFSHHERFIVLSEEFGEIATELMPLIKGCDPTTFNIDRLREELIDLIAPAIIWLEAIEKEKLNHDPNT